MPTGTERKKDATKGIIFVRGLTAEKDSCNSRIGCNDHACVGGRPLESSGKRKKEELFGMGKMRREAY